MSEKKRKGSSKEGERPSKKQQISTVKVQHVAGPDIATPVIATSPGTAFPDVAFKSFAKTHNGKSNLLLQSSDHPTLEYTAREGDTSIENHLKHYVAVFDPEKGKLQVTEAKHLTVRSALRSAMPARGAEENGAVVNYLSRRALVDEFGTKKSKKIAHAAQENRQLAQGSQEMNEPVSAALISHVAEDEGLDNGTSLIDSLSNKPLPPVDLGADDISQVYSLEKLIIPSPATRTLEVMPVQSWKDRLAQKKDVKTRLRFVAARVGYLAIADDSISEADRAICDRAIQVMRYIQVLTEIHTYVTRLPRRRQIPNIEDWPEQTLSADTPNWLLRPIMKHFFPDRTPKDHSITLLRTTILALTLQIPPPSITGLKNDKKLMTEPIDISLDLAIDAADVRKLYRELGCKVAPAKETELAKMGLERLTKRVKDEAGHALPKPSLVTLAFPLDFPKISRGRQSRR